MHIFIDEEGKISSVNDYVQISREELQEKLVKAEGIVSQIKIAIEDYDKLAATIAPVAPTENLAPMPEVPAPTLPVPEIPVSQSVPIQIQ